MISLVAIFSNCNAKSEKVAPSVVPDGAAILIKAYPDFHLRYANNKIIFPDGFSVVYDDHQKKSFTQLMDNSDIEDMFTMRYNRKDEPPRYLEDAGRARSEALFKKMYGASAASVARHLVTINWFGTNIRFTTVNGASRHLLEVKSEIAKHPELVKYMKNSSSFYWRKVRGGQIARVLIVMALRLTFARSTLTSGYGRILARKRLSISDTKTIFLLRSSVSSKSTDSYGAGTGITSTRCTLNIVRRSWRQIDDRKIEAYEM